MKRQAPTRTHRQMVAAWKKDPEFKAAYDELDTEFALLRQFPGRFTWIIHRLSQGPRRGPVGSRTRYPLIGTACSSFSRDGFTP